MYDITDTEEAMLPLPVDWIRTVNAEGSTVYRNKNTDVTSVEHPYIQHGAVMTDSLPLPDGWTLREAAVEGAPSEQFYYHATTGTTGWDHPQLRHCVAHTLEQHGYSIICAKLLETSPAAVAEPDWNIFASPKKPLTNGISEQFVKFKEAQVETSDAPGIQNVNWVGMMQRLESTQQDEDADEPPPEDEHYESDGASDVSSSRSNSYIDYAGRYSDIDDSLVYSQSDGYDQEQHFILSPTTLNVSKRSKKWDELKMSMTRGKDGRAESFVPVGMPQVNAAGVAILRSRIKDANADIQNLLLQTRTILCHSQDVECSTLNTLDPRLLRGSSHNTLRLRELTERAGSVVGYLRHQPKLLIPALGILWNTSGPVMVATLSFIVFNRMLHPFSTDGSMSTAFLLEAVNYQVEDTADVINVFPKVDPRVLMSRAIFMSDAKVALSWDPLLEPMPMLTQHNTLLSCALKAYSVRRDVSSYFRATWKPVLPALVSIIEPVTPMSISESHMRIREAEHDRIVSVQNIVSVAFKLIELLIIDENMVMFPISATAVCRTLYELCGLDGVHSYILNFLVLPNLIKLLLGHHDSADCEEIIRYNPSGIQSDAYFDKSVWFRSYELSDEFAKNSTAVVSHDGKTVYDPISLLIWSTWRLYVLALLMDGAALTTMTAADFFEPLRIDKKSLPMNDIRVRNLISRTRTKIDNGVSLLLKLPVDSHACAFLDLDPSAAVVGLEKRAGNMTQLLSRRLSSLLVKPAAMTMHLVVSDYELHMLFQSVATLLDVSGQEGYDDLMESISRYEHISERLGMEREETIMLLKVADDQHERLPEAIQNEASVGTKFLAANDVISGHSVPAQSVVHSIEVEFHRLARGIKLSQKYIDSLTRLHRRLETNTECTLTELVEDDAWFFAPEYEFDYHMDSAPCRKKKTQAWASKVKPSLHGLTGMLQKQQAVLKAKETHVTLIKQEEQFFKSYRDADKEYSVTSAFSVHSKHNSGRSQKSIRGKPQYTKVTIDSNAKFSAPTMSVISKASAPLDPTSADLHKEYVKSLRSDGSAAGSKAESKRRVHRSMEGSSSVASTKKSQSTASPAPFPEHLRHRVRGNNSTRGFVAGDENDDRSTNSAVESAELHRALRSTELQTDRSTKSPPHSTFATVPGSKFNSAQARHPKMIKRYEDYPVDRGIFSPESMQHSIPSKLTQRVRNRESAGNSVVSENNTYAAHTYVGNYLEEEAFFDSDAMEDMVAPSRISPTSNLGAVKTPESDKLYSPESAHQSPEMSSVHHSPLSDFHERVEWDSYNAEDGATETDGPAPAPPKRAVPLIPAARAHSRIDLIRAIESGFTATKHCRNGWPKEREIYYDDIEKTISWREPEGKSAGVFSRFMRSSSSRTKDGNSMLVNSISEIKRGVQTEIMKKVGLVDPECCLSICNEERTLDLTFNSTEDRNYFIRSLQALVYPTEIFMT